MNNYKEQLQIIKQGIDEIIGEKELIAKLRSNNYISQVNQFVEPKYFYRNSSRKLWFSENQS